MTNPFVYGEVVPPTAFVDREDELDRLTRDLLAGQKVFLISPRRYGKSSLVRQALPRPRARRRADRRRHRQQLQLVRRLSRRLCPGAVVDRDADRTRDGVAARSARAGPAGSADRDVAGRQARRSRVSFPSARTDRDVSRLAQEVFALPGRIADSARPQAGDRARRVPGDRRLQRRQRRACAARRGPAPAQVGYVFSGSEPALMERMLGTQPAVLQGRPGHAAGPNSRRSVRARSSKRGSSAPASSRAPGLGAGDRRARRQPALRRAAARARALGRRAGGRTADAWTSRICTRR